MRALITGASGFLGEYCLAAMDAQALDAGVDLCNPDQLTAAITRAKPDAVIHLAARSSVAESLTDPVATFDVNLMGTLNLLMALERAAFSGRFLFISSGDSYGPVADADLPVRETQPLRPMNPYAVSKVAGEILCAQWSRSRDFELVIARPFNQTGPRQSPTFVVSDLGRQFSAIQRGEKPPEITLGDHDVTRDFTDVRDAVRALALLLEHGANGEAYNVCSGIERSIGDIVGMYSHIVGVPVTIRQDVQRLRRSEQRRMRGSFEKLHKDTGWAPSIPLETTLRDILQYWIEKETT